MQNARRPLALLLAFCMIFSLLPISALAINITTKPENGTTVGQPFASGTGGSTYFRIPGIVTLDNGTLIAACDARWNHTGDGAGLDTIVSVSTDNGENWTYTFANYLGDNGDVYNNLSTCIIDPGIGTDGTTAYLIADLWPAGIALNTSKYSPVAGKTGYDANGNLILRDASKDTVTIGYSGYNTMAANAAYDYYLDLKTLTLHKNDGTAVEGYTVDAYFNITGEGVNTNLFFSDSPYQPYPTDYLYMTTSTDGLNWSAPTLLNLKEASEQTLLVGPGNGTYDAVNDRMIFTAYDHTSGYERACLIWMDSEGEWHRTADATGSSNWSSEASSVVLEDGTVRCFYRDGFYVVRYTDYIWSEAEGNYVPDYNSYEVSTSAPKQQRNQLTSILYSEKIDGKEAILVSCAATSGSRTDGHLYVFLVNEDKTMDLAYDYDIVPGEIENYAYNCLTELADGNLGLLYESNSAEITYIVIDIDDVLVRDNDPRLTVKEVELLEGYSKTFTDNSGCYVGADISELNTEVATLTMTGEEVVTNAAMVLANSANIDLDSCQYTFTATADGYYEVSALTADGTTVYLNHFSTSNNNVPNLTSPAGKIAILESSHENMFKLQAQIIEGAGSGAARGLHFHAEASAPYWNRCGNDNTYKCHEYLFRKAESGETASTEIPGYVMLTSADQVVDGGQYLIAAKNDAGNWFVLNPATSSDKFGHVAQIMGSTTVGHTELTFTGVAAGYTEVVVGSTLYKLTVHNVDEVEVNVAVGESVTVTEPNGNYADADTSALNTAIATVTMVGVDGTTANGLSLAPVSELTEGTYVIVNTRAKKLVTNDPANAAAEAGAGSGLYLNGTVNNEIAANAVWTISGSNGSYTIRDLNGKYMTISSNNAGVVDTAATLTLNWRGSTWTIAQNGAYLNHFGGGSSTCAAGWQSSSAAGDEGSQFAIYAYSEEVRGSSTELTFTGVAAGTTSLLVGRTNFLITVTDGTEAPHQHTWSDWAVTTAPTCTEAGEETRTCECGESETREVEALGHDWNDGVCGNCGEEQELPVDPIDPNDPWGKKNWVKVEVDSETIWNDTEGNFEYAWDGDLNTIWHSNWKGTKDVLTGENTISGTIDFTREYVINQFSFTPRQDYTYWENGSGVVLQASLYVKDADDTEWKLVAEHVEFEHNQDKKTIYFEEQAVRYVKFVAEKASYMDQNEGWVAVAEFDIDLVKADVHEHTWSDWSYTTEPTCTEAGEETRTCECGETETREAAALGHDYVAEFIEPTCSKSGYTLYTCSRCGKSYKDDPVEPEHKWDEGTVTAPTCTEQGYTTYTCTVCGEKYVDEASWVPATGHAEETVPGTPATYDNTGLTDGVRCANCGETLTAQETIPTLDYNEGTIPVSALNATAGDFYGSDVPANALDGNLSTMWHTDWYGSSREGHWIQFEITGDYAVDGLRYKPRTDTNRQGEPQLNGTITEYKIQVSNDGVNFVDVATGNWDANQNWKTVEFDAQTVKYVRLVSVDACTDNDSVFASAAEIRLTGEAVEIPEPQTLVLGTNEVMVDADQTVTATWTAEEDAILNLNIPYIYYQDPVSFEFFGEEWTELPVDRAFRYGWYTLTINGIANDLGIASVEVKAGDVVTVEIGNLYGYLSKVIVNLSVEEPHTHSYTAVVTDPTCTEGGYTTYTCSCGDTYVADETAALGHTEEVLPAVDASCTETGLTEGKKCSVCDEILVAQEIIPATGHSWKGTGCENCDETRENPFVDVDEKVHASFFDAILWAVEEGITTGTDATHFNPNGKCDRATIVTFLWRAAGKPEPTTTENPFVDVKESHFFYKAVLWAYENGITTGIDATHFNPYGKCTRAQVVTFLWRAEGKPAPTSTESTFTDVTNAKEFYYNAVLWAAENGITNGINATTFGVNSICNRAQVVTFLYRCAK